jgi:signal transduction histidine kinase
MSKSSLTAGQMSGNKEVQTVVTLASSIAHEIKNYLAAINICAELSENQLANIKKTVRSADYLIGNLQMQIKGVVTGKPGREGFKRCSIARDIEKVLEQYPFKTGERDLISAETAGDFEYTGNPSLTQHVLYNLIKNALQAIRSVDKGEITIKLKPGRKGNRIVFRDTATGIPEDFLPKIFELFKIQKAQQGGTGVGLAFCKTIMQSYGGDITCDSAEGEYTEFIMYFPLKP